MTAGLTEDRGDVLQPPMVGESSMQIDIEGKTKAVVQPTDGLHGGTPVKTAGLENHVVPQVQQPGAHPPRTNSFEGSTPASM